MARGRKKKVPEIVQEVIDRALSDEPTEISEITKLDPIQVEQKDTNNIWDVPLGTSIEYFDPTLSYEISGYKPIDETRGLDFNPEWFIQARKTKEETGKYCAYLPGSKGYDDFWIEEYKRCIEGFESHGYRITGDNYFFLNYYILKDVKVEKSGSGRTSSFPAFFSKQYEYFHYIDICERLRKDVGALKARGVGFSEIAASLGLRMYTTVPESHTAYIASSAGLLNPTLRKCWQQMENLNSNTEGGMYQPRLGKNTDMHKRASLKSKQGEEFGWMSDIIGIIVDEPRKLRGERFDRLFFEESGSNPTLAKTYIQSTALVEILGEKFGTRFVWGKI